MQRHTSKGQHSAPETPARWSGKDTRMLAFGLVGFVGLLTYGLWVVDPLKWHTAAGEHAAPVVIARAAKPRPAQSAIAVRLASASAEEGAAGAMVCRSCHAFAPGAPAVVGPNLYEVAGRDIGVAAGFHYSAALSSLKGKWDDETLDHFLADPKSAAPGTTMGFAGLRNPADRANLIAYLHTLAPGGSPPAAPVEIAAAPAPELAPQPAEASAPTMTLEARLAAADLRKGRDAVAMCQTCHSVDAGAPALVGPSLAGVAGRRIGSAPGFSYSAAMKSQAGRWTEAKLDAFLADPRKVVPNTTMLFPGVPDAQMRASLIAYLHTLKGGAAPSLAAPTPAGASPIPVPVAPTAPAGGDKPSAPDAAAGAQAALACKACHAMTAGAPPMFGPNLAGVFGRKVAGASGFMFSPALSAMDGAWTEASLDKFLQAPMAVAPGTTMAFPGVANADDRRNIIAYLKTLK